ncbi:MAG: SIS domain-containing protein [bacterium]
MHDQMWTWLNEFPQQMKHAAELGATWDAGLSNPPRAVVFLGIGGSAIGAATVTELFAQYFSCPVFVHRGVSPPAWVGEDCLAVAVSYSGNTSETLEAFQQTLDAGADGASISSGGKLAELAAARAIPHLMIPGGIMPRAALGYTSIPLIYLLQSAGAMKSAELPVQKLVAELTRLRADWSDRSGAGMGIARRILRRFPIVVGAGLTNSAARRFQAQLAENSKVLAQTFEIPEAMHNVIETLDLAALEPLRPIAVYLEDPQTPEELRILMSLARRSFQNAGVEGVILQTEGTEDLIRLYSLIHKLDWVSYHLAALRNVDPVGIPLIMGLKERYVAQKTKK